jgi:hypothetical protein
MSEVLLALSGELFPYLAATRPPIKPKDAHSIPFHLPMSEQKAAKYKQAREMVLQTCASLLNALHFLWTQGYISKYGVELPAIGTTGDAYLCIRDAKESLAIVEKALDAIDDSFAEQDDAPPDRRHEPKPDIHGNGEPDELSPPRQRHDTDTDTDEADD